MSISRGSEGVVVVRRGARIVALAAALEKQWSLGDWSAVEDLDTEETNPVAFVCKSGGTAKFGPGTRLR